MALDEDPPPVLPDWIITYGDMMSLLLTFFIMLASMSEIKPDGRFQRMADSMREQFGTDRAPLSLVPGWARSKNTAPPDADGAGRGKPAPPGESPRVTIIRPGKQTAVGTVLFFAETAAELTRENQEDLLAIAPHVCGKPLKIEVRGHTSQRPVDPQSGDSDNWDLAYRRCRNTVKFLVEELEIDPRRVRMSVAGPNEPLTFEPIPGRGRQNPRVEVFLLDELFSEYPEERGLAPAEAKP